MTTDLSRLERPDGSWATFRTHYGFGPATRIQATLLDGDGSESFMRSLVRETLTGCHLLADGGGWVDWSASPETPVLADAQMDTIDGYVGEAVLARCNAIWRAWFKGRPDPKGTSAPSTATSPDRP